MAIVRNKKKLIHQLSFYSKSIQDKAEKCLTIIEADIFCLKDLKESLKNVDVVVSLLNFHRKNNRGWKVDHYEKFSNVLIDSMEEMNVENFLGLFPWYTDDRGKTIRNKGISGCGTKFMLNYCKGHLLKDMDKALSNFEASDLSWTSLHVPTLKRGERLDRSIHTEQGDRVQHIIDNYPFYKSEYHSMRYSDIAHFLLGIIENKISVPEKSKVAASYAF